MFTTPEEIIERLSAERGHPVRVEYNHERRAWFFLVPSGGDWYYVKGCQGRTALACLTIAWAMWMNRRKVLPPNPQHNGRGK